MTPVMNTSTATASGRREVRFGFSGRDRRQQIGLDLRTGLTPSRVPNHDLSLIHAFEGDIQADRRRRQPLAKHIDEHSTFGLGTASVPGQRRRRHSFDPLERPSRSTAWPLASILTLATDRKNRCR